ncbi:MAG TPA: phytoene/squalene synthase family protein [Pyrinomonadaceae bacterium]|nr:phytoene/squalene synthase family protein [Pyrinomonadaceae bacterium]
MQTQANKDFLEKGWQECEAITKKYGTSYYFATQFFPKDIKRAIYSIYSFARIPDEIVDDPNLKDSAEAIAKLNEWRDEWLEAMQNGRGKTPIMHAIVHTFQTKNIPVSEGEAFLKSMFMDEEKFVYENYAELEKYMYGSAGVIGLLVTRIVGYSSENAFQYALKLGYAFQLTNFLRDIKADFQLLGRIYMPLDELAQFNLTADDIKNEVYDERFIDFMKFQIERNRQIYRESLLGIPMLKWHGRFAVKISYVLYKAILREIEKVNYNVYLGRVRTNLRQKIWLTTKALVGIYE